MTAGSFRFSYKTVVVPRFYMRKWWSCIFSLWNRPIIILGTLDFSDNIAGYNRNRHCITVDEIFAEKVLANKRRPLLGMEVGLRKV